MENVFTSSIKRTLLRGPELPTGELRDHVLVNLYNQLADVMKPLSMVTAFNACTVALVYGRYAGWLLTALWLLPLLGFSFYQFYSSRKMSRRTLDKAPSGQFLKRGARNTFLFGVWWALSCVIFISDNDVLNVCLAPLAMGMCAASTACLGPNAGMAAKFTMGAVPVTIFSLLLFDSSAATLTAVLGCALAATLIYMSHLKYLDTVNMLAARINLEKSHSRLQSALEVSGIGVKIVDTDGAIVFENQTHEDAMSKISRSLRDANGFYRGSGEHFKKTDVSSPSEDKISVIENVSDFVNAQREIIQARKEAEDALAAKSRFMQSVSDELKLPLASIKSAIRLIQPDSRIDFSRDDLHGLGKVIGESSRDLEVLIDALIQYSDGNQNLTEFAIEEVEPLIRKTIRTSLASVGLDKRMEDLTLRVEDQVSIIGPARDSFSRIISQLTSNAAKFSKAGTPILVALKKVDDENVALIVRDHGDGISKDKIAEITQPVPFETNGEDSQRGYGLGLSIVARHIKNLGGQYRIQSEVEKMTNVIVTLPARNFVVVSERNRPPLAEQVLH